MAHQKDQPITGSESINLKTCLSKNKNWTISKALASPMSHRHNLMVRISVTGPVLRPAMWNSMDYNTSKLFHSIIHSLWPHLIDLRFPFICQTSLKSKLSSKNFHYSHKNGPYLVVVGKSLQLCINNTPKILQLFFNLRFLWSIIFT